MQSVNEPHEIATPHPACWAAVHALPSSVTACYLPDGAEGAGPDTVTCAVCGDTWQITPADPEVVAHVRRRFLAVLLAQDAPIFPVGSAA